MNSTPARTLQTVVLALFVVGLIALALGGYLAPLSRIVITPLVTAQTYLSTRFQAVQNYFTTPQDLARLRQRNAELEAEVSRLQAEVIDLQEQLAETRILDELLQFRRKNPEKRMRAAAVIGRDPSPYLQYVIINSGSDDGLRRGMPVVTSQGLVGRISRVTADGATVQLITDTDSSINVQLESTSAQAILTGQVTGEVTLEMIPQSVQVQTNEIVLTSGLGGNFPPNIVVGQVSGIRSRDYDLFKSAAVQPAVDFSKLEIVLVITNFRPIDISPLVPTPSAP